MTKQEIILRKQEKIIQLKEKEIELQESAKAAIDSREYGFAKERINQVIFVEDTIIELEYDISRLREEIEDENE